MRKDLIASAVAALALTVLLGLAYPLAVTGVAQVLWPNKSDGSQIKRDGKVVGSRLIGQTFAGRRDYFQSRPSQSGYAADATFFSNAGPNSQDLSDRLRARAERYLRRERPFNPGLRLADVPADAVFTSASGVDPHISVDNARIQAGRVASERRLSRDAVLRLIDDNTDGRGLGVLGEPGVNVLELNLALDRETRR